MGRRKEKDKNIRKLTKLGGGSSYAVTIPISIIRKWKWRERQKLVVEADDKKKRLIIRDWSPTRKK